MSEKRQTNKEITLSKKPENPVQNILNVAIDLIHSLDIPAKGRLVHHIRKGRINQALNLINSGKMQLLQRFADSRQYSVLKTVQCISQLENQLKSLVLKPKGGLT